MNVLIIEDDAGLVELIKEKIEEGGFTAASVHTAAEALLWLKQNTPNLMILDYSLPDMNGKEFITALKNSNELIAPFIVSTGRGDELLAVEMMKLGAMDYLVKNQFFLDKLPEALKRIEKEIENENKAKQAEEALKKSEESYRTLFEKASDGILYLTEKLRIIKVNESFAQMHGYSVDEMIDMRIQDLDTPETSRFMAANFAKLLEGGTVKFEVEHYHKDGHIFPLEVSSSTISIGNEIIIQSFHRDITERKRMQQEREVLYEITRSNSEDATLEELLRLIHQSLKKAVYAENCFVAFYDETNDSFSYPYFVDKFDSPPAPEPIGKSSTAYVLKTGKTMLLAQGLFNQLEKQNEVELVGTPSPSWIGVPLKTTSKIIGVLVLQHYEDTNIYTERDVKFLETVGSQIANIIERKQAEEKLRQSEEKFKNLVWNMQVGVILQNPDAEIFLSNPKALELLGLTEEQLLGKTSFDPSWDVIHEDGSPFPGATHPVPQAIATKAPVRNIIMGVYRPTTQNRVWLLVDAEPQFNANGTLLHVVCTFIDISDRKQAELIIQQKNEELQELNSAKDKFFSIISHDLKSPFHGFLGLTEIMAEEGNTFAAEEWKNVGRELHNTASNLFKLLKNLLEWSQMQQGSMPFEPKQFSLSELIAQTIETLSQRSAQKGIKLVNNASAPITAFADEQMVNSILRNLLSNSVKFTRKDGTITVTATKIENNLIKLAITDTGIGMSKILVDRLFKVGEKTGKKGTAGEESTGLGLLLCKEFVEKNGGKIWVESEENKGSAFYFTLPEAVN